MTIERYSLRNMLRCRSWKPDYYMIVIWAIGLPVCLLVWCATALAVHETVKHLLGGCS